MPITLLTGAPGSGKTAAIRRVLEATRPDAGGFYTREIRVAGRRLGCEIVTLDGQTGAARNVPNSIPTALVHNV